MDEKPEIGADANTYVLGTGSASRGFASAAISSYFPNIESYPGELFVKPPLTSKRLEVRLARDAAVRQARALERTNEHMRGGLDKRVDMVVGATLRVMPKPDWNLLADAAGPNSGFTREWARDFTGQAYRQFNDWGYGNRLLADAEGHYNFGGLMWMNHRMLEGPDAETAGVIHYDQERADAYNHRWATFITTLDPDRIRNPLGQVDGNEWWSGRELDKNGRWTALNISSGYPTEGGIEDLATNDIRVPRESSVGRPMAWHFFRKTRPGQQRGLTKRITILRATGMFDNLDDALLANATKSATLATYVETLASADTVAEQLAPAGPGQPSAWDTKLNYYDKTKMRLGNQRLVIMPPGDKVIMEAMESALADPSAFRNGFLRMFASALNISFEQLSNNFSEANYSSARAALLEVWRGVVVDRVFFTSHVASLIYAAVIEEAIAKGRIKLPPNAPSFYEYRDAYTACLWTGPGMGWIDPQKEAAAQAIRLSSKTSTREKEIAEQGGDWVEVFEQLAEENDLADELEIDLTPVDNTKDALNTDEPGPDNPSGDQRTNKPKPAASPAPKKQGA